MTAKPAFSPQRLHTLVSIFGTECERRQVLLAAENQRIEGTASDFSPARPVSDAEPALGGGAPMRRLDPELPLIDNLEPPRPRYDT